MFACNTDSFPRIDCYADALRHYERVKPWRGAWNTNERPIGVRSHKNKVMRKLDDGSIAFRLYSTDVVTYHPNGDVTVHGYPSVSTSSFANTLLPSGVSHRQGSRDRWEPVLEIRRKGENYWYEDKTQPYTGWDDRTYYRYRRNPDILVTKCRPVTLRFDEGERRYLPLDPSPFKYQVIDRKAAREVSRRFHLAEFEHWAQAYLALSGRPDEAVGPYSRGSMDEIAGCLLERDFLMALTLCPFGGGSRAFGRRYASSEELEPGFLRRLRDHVYYAEGATTTVSRPVLTIGQYQSYLQSQRRFG